MCTVAIIVLQAAASCGIENQQRSAKYPHACAALFHHFKDPIMITEGKMQYLYDDKGRRYLDVGLCSIHLPLYLQKTCHMFSVCMAIRTS